MIEISQKGISLTEIFKQFKRKFYYFVIPSLIIFISIVIYVFNKSDEFKSEVVLISASSNGNLKLSGQLGGLAALAGVNLGSMNGSDKSLIAIETLKSKKFIVDFVRKHNIEPELKAAIGWDRKSNKLIFNKNVYDTEKNIWRNKEDGTSKKPSFDEIYELFESRYSISQDKTTGIVKLSFIHYSPHVAKKVVELVVNDINNLIREKDTEEYKASIGYLNEKTKIEKNEELAKLLYNLIEEQNKNLMLANIKSNYVFETIDPAVAADKKFGPKRFILVISSLISIIILNLMISVFLLLNNRNKS